GGRVGTIGTKCGDDRFASGGPGIAFKQDESPGCEFAVVGHSRGNFQERLDFGSGRAGSRQFDWLNRTAGVNQFSGAWRPSAPKIGAAFAPTTVIRAPTRLPP